MTAADVRKYADGKLAHYKIPRYVRIVEDFPMTASGKVRKVEMREAAVGMLGLTERHLSKRAVGRSPGARSVSTGRTVGRTVRRRELESDAQ